MFLTLEEFLSHFPEKEMTKEEFSKEFKVMYSTPQTLDDIFRLVPAKYTKKGVPKCIITKPDTDRRYLRKDDVIDYFYEIVITGRHKYLTFFFHAYFDFKDPVREMKWEYDSKIMSEKECFSPYKVISSQKNDSSRRLIRNLFYLHLLDKTKVTNSVKSHVSFWTSLTNMYNKLELEDRMFAPSSIDLFLREKKTLKDGVTINYNNLFYLFQAYQPKASIFNPYTIKWIYDKLFVPNISTETKRGEYTILTPVLSWASYLMAFYHSDDFGTYIGVDVMDSVCKQSKFLSKWYQKEYGIKRNVTITCTPSEKMQIEENSVDCIILCPPYYDMEIYPEGEQSISTFKTYEDWLTGYWEETMKRCHSASKEGAVLGVILNDYYTLDGKKYELTKDMREITEKYFTFCDMYYLQNRTSPLRVNAKDRTERFFLFKKS